MKKLIKIIALVVALGNLPLAAQAAPKHASIVVDAQSGKVILAENAESLRHPASLTKIMTLYMTFKSLKHGQLRMNQRLRVSAFAASQAPSKLGLRRGTTIRVRDAILGLITQSANDAAVVLAEAIGGSESNFARQMTQQARMLRMSRTIFRNASGLPHDAQVTTARDMAILARAMIVNFPEYYPLFRTPRFTYLGVTHENHNHLMKRYTGMDGMKTGYIRASGFNLVASVVRGKTRLIGVIFGGSSARSRDQNMATLLNHTFAWADRNHTPGSAAAKNAVAATTPERAANGVPVLAQGDSADGETQAAEAALRSPTMPGGALITTPAASPAMTVIPVSAPIPASPQFVRTGAGVSTASAQAARADATAFPLRRPASPPQDQTARPADAPKIPGWGVQIGAYHNRKASEQAIMHLGRRLPRRVHDTHYEIVAIKTAQTTVYRVRLLGLDEKAARIICRNATGDGRNCVLIPPAA